MSSIVGVHGVGNYRADLSAEEAAAWLSRVWRRHLLDGAGTALESVDLTVAYYADELAAPGQQGAGVDLTGDPELEQMVLAWAALLGAPEEVAQGWLTLPARQAMSWIAEKFGLDQQLVVWFAERFFGEVGAYFRQASHGGSQSPVRTRLADAIAHTGTRVVIAHSLGSVVAYETLWARPDLKVDLLITLGSPLGMPNVVFDHLTPPAEKRMGNRPPNVARWINIADPGDLIAIPRWLATRFHGIDADEETPVHVFDFHKVANYLRNGKTRQRVVQALG